ncbi:uncharacterized protein LOC135946376 [Cloeon dipterum]|uniref:uncharacterized protein LOC135946376 n=1 Tax=Cloeon dipterum TaxID=197152 RepID=UPI0032208D66
MQHLQLEIILLCYFAMPHLLQFIILLNPIFFCSKVSKGLNDDAKNKLLGVADVTKEYTLEALVPKLDSASTATPIKEIQNGRILGGKPLTAATFLPPFTAYVFIQSFNLAGVVIQDCGGVILSPNWVLTAAHCVALARSITVFAGTITNPTASNVKSEATPLIHPDFSLNLVTNDIALLSLETPFTLSGTVGTALLSTVNATDALELDNILFTTMGFGPADDTSLVAAKPTLNVIDMQNMNKETCNLHTIGIFVEYPENTGCLSTASGTKGICYADEGGPVFYTSPDENTGQIIGINSQMLGCPRRQPSSFTWIHPYITWIESTTLENFSKVQHICNLAAAAGFTMRSSLWIVVLAILAQASARVSKCLKEDAEKTGNLDVEDFTLEALLAEANYTETEIFLSKLESITNSGVDSTTATPINEIKNATNGKGRILGGKPLTAATFVPPYTAYAFVRALNAAGGVIRECGGVILSSVWVLTAAHCVALAKDITVIAGETEISILPLVKSGAKAIIHPDFRLNFLTNDIALLRLDTPFALSGTVGTALLSTVKPTAALDNIVFTTMGFGPPGDATVLDVVPVLTVVEMRNMKKASCNAPAIGVFVTYPGNTGCLSTETGKKGICYADPGGPVFHTSPEDITAKIIGINSQYIGCPSQQPSSFTWIFPYIPWIQAKTFKKLT